MKKIRVDIDKSKGYISDSDINALIPKAEAAMRALNDRNMPGGDFLGWLELPERIDAKELERVKACAEKIRNDSEILVVVGIGGSYLGARAALDFLGHSFKEYLTKAQKGSPHVIFAGNSLSAAYHSQLLEVLDGRDVSVNVISKSGTTTEPALAFRVLKGFMEKKYGKEEAAKRIYATTDAKRGALKSLSEAEGYETFVIPDDVGGRYSVLTPVGLLPIAAGGSDIDAMITGAKDGMREYAGADMAENECIRYAVARNALHNKGKLIEILVNYEPSLRYFTEWWKQLYGESEGKDGKGIFPAGVDFSADLHSMGQYIQDGARILFETVLDISAPKGKLEVPYDPEDLDGLNFIAGKDYSYVNKKAFEGTLLAHVDGKVPQIVISVPGQDEYSFGKLVYFFEKACGISGYMLGVNPFDQPGVEAYKKNMFALLGKPGYEKEREALLERLKI